MDKNRDFDKWLANFKISIANYEYYIDFNTVYRNVNEIKIELNILNSLIGVSNIEKEFISLVEKYPETLKCIPILLAKREKEIKCTDEKGSLSYDFYKKNYSIDQYCYFMKRTGLFELLQNHVINNLIDYVLGVEVGLNSNARKNRGGHLMEDLVEKYIIKSGYVKNKTYFKEMYLSDIEKQLNINLTQISNDGNTEKRFDFVIFTEEKVYAIECNFYASSGSKLNETARSYKNIAVNSKSIKNFEFVWITDGQGWLSAKKNLYETFMVLEHMYSIADLESGIFTKMLKN